jgi:hypothetical protein
VGKKTKQGKIHTAPLSSETRQKMNVEAQLSQKNKFFFANDINVPLTFVIL